MNPLQTFADDEPDLILQSRDGVKFPIRRTVLEDISVVFAKLFSTKCPPPKEDLKKLSYVREEVFNPPLLVNDKIPNSPILDYIVRLGYRKPRHEPETFDEIVELIDAGDFWRIEPLMNEARVWLMKDIFLEKEPFRVYSVACRLKWKAESAQAAQATLYHSWSSITYTFEMEKMTGGDLYRLQKYHRRCGEVASALTREANFAWIKDREWPWFGSSVCKYRGPAYPKSFTIEGGISVWLVQRWWMEWMDSAEKSLRENPCRESVRRAGALENGCKCCAKMSKKIEEFEEMFGEAVEEVIENVSRDIIQFGVESNILCLTGSPGGGLKKGTKRYSVQNLEAPCKLT